MHFKWVPTTHAIIYMLWVLIWTVDAIQMGTNNISFYIYVVGTHLNCTVKLMHFKWVPTTYTFINMCCQYSFELHWQVDAFQMDANNIHFYIYIVDTHLNCIEKLMHFQMGTNNVCFIYVVGTHFNCIDKLMHFKWVPTTYPFIYMLWALIWIALTSWCISNGYHILLYICCGHSFELHWQVDAIQMGTNNIRLYIYMLWVLIWITQTIWCISNGYQQHILSYICCGYSFELQWQIDAFQIGTNNIHFYKYVLWVLIWITLTSWCILNGCQQHTLLYICCGSFELH